MYQSVNKPFGLNHSLAYLPWTQLLEGISNEDRGFICDSCVGASESPSNTIRLVAGMKLIVDDSTVTGVRTNKAVPGICRYEWQVPAGTIGPADYFFLSYLLMSCQPDPTAAQPSEHDLVKRMWAMVSRMATANATAFRDQLSDLLAKNFLPSLAMTHSRSGEWSRPAGTAARVREWLTEPSALDLGAVPYSEFRPTQSLHAQIPFDEGAGVNLVGISAFQSGSAFFLDNVPAPKAVPLQRNPWYNKSADSINRRRQRMEVLIPIRTFGDLWWQYIPVYYSLSDLERDIGIIITAIRRGPQWVGCVKDRGRLEMDRKRLISKGDGRVGINFVDVGTLGAQDVVLITEGRLKDDLLLAPGDVVSHETRPHVL